MSKKIKKHQIRKAKDSFNKGILCGVCCHSHWLTVETYQVGQCAEWIRGCKCHDGSFVLMSNIKFIELMGKLKT